MFFLKTTIWYLIFIQNACYILTSKAQAIYEVFHITIFLLNYKNNIDKKNQTLIV